MNQQILHSENEFDEIFSSLAKAIIDKVKLEDLILIGIRTRGVPIAERLAEKVTNLTGKKPQTGILDITLYRDDLTTIAEQPVMKKTEIPFSISKKTIFLVDDVLFTGRTIRCALDALFDFGRPQAVHLVVLVERSGRELPIEATVSALKIATEPNDNIKVSLKEIDGFDQIEKVTTNN